jgi:endonuclease-3
MLERAHGPRPIPVAGRRKCLDELIASMLAQNTNVANAHSGYKQLRRGFSSWTQVMNAPVDAVQRTIAVCGLARLRARRMQNVLRDIKARHGKLDLQFLGDQEPQAAFEHLTSYYGIGPKTAAYTLLFSFNMPLFPVDKGIHRMAKRLKIVRPKAGEAETAHTIERTLSSPSSQCFPLHVLMFDHAKRFCRPRNPKCRQCNLVMICPSGKLRLRHRKSKQIDTARTKPRRPRPIILSHHASAGLVRHGDGEAVE